MMIDMPYAAFLGLRFEQEEEGDFLAVLPHSEHLEGRPGYLHGGVLGGVLECVAIHKVMSVVEPRNGRLARPINIGINYLRGAARATTYAKAEIVRQGARILVVAVRVWQDDPARPVVIGQVNLMR